MNINTLTNCITAVPLISSSILLLPNQHIEQEKKLAILSGDSLFFVGAQVTLNSDDPLEQLIGATLVIGGISLRVFYQLPRGSLSHRAYKSLCVTNLTLALSGTATLLTRSLFHRSANYFSQ